MRDILIFSGQSNMQGQTDVCPPQIPVEGGVEYKFLSDEFQPLCHPVGEDIEGDMLWAAFEKKGALMPDFCKAYIQKTGQEVVAVHAARGATQVHQWLPPCRRFEVFVAKCKAAIEKTKQTYGVGKIWLIWLQGESDALADLSTEEYKERLRTFKAAVSEQIPLDGFGIIRVGKFADAVVDKNANDLKILHAQEELCQTEEFTMLTRMTGVCTQDPARYINPFYKGHYNNEAMTMIGHAAGENLGRLVMGEPVILEEEPYDDMRPIVD